EHRQRGGKTADGNVLDVQRHLFDTADSVLQPGPHTVNDVDVCFQFGADHADRVLDAVMAVDVEMLADRVDHHVIHGDVHRFGIEQDVADFLGRDLAFLVRDGDVAAV